MRIIEPENEGTTLPVEEETPAVKKSEMKVVSEKISPQKEMLYIAKEIHELGNKLMELASEL